MSNLFIKPNRKVDRIFLHCTASDSTSYNTVASIRRDHTSPPRNWNDIGYHFLITKDGKIHTGRNIEKSPAAQRGHNQRSIAICLAGLKKEKFTQAQYDALKLFCIEINNAYFKDVSFHGHCEVASKACPVIDYKHILKLDAYGSLGLEKPHVISSEPLVESYPELNLDDRGEDVIRLQKLLGITSDGDYGSRTLAKVKEFKRQHSLYPSGIVSKEVWKLLMKPVLDNIRTVNLDNLPDLKTRSRGKSVEFLQELLLIKVDGIFGAGTAKAVKAFKKEHNLYPSDIVQRHVWKLLLDTLEREHYD